MDKYLIGYISGLITAEETLYMSDLQNNKFTKVIDGQIWDNETETFNSVEDYVNNLIVVEDSTQLDNFWYLNSQ